MAERRMMSKSVIDTDYFLEMPSSTQCLYFHLCMRADDDGFVSSPKKIMAMTGSSGDDYRILMSKQFIIPFESGVCVITHWRIHNLIRADRYKPTMYQDEKQQLDIDTNHTYMIASDSGEIGVGNQMDTNGIQNDSLGKDRLGKDRLGKDKINCKAEALPYTEILDYLNTECKAHYRNTDNFKRLIKARMNEGYTVQDFKTVVDKKKKAWFRDNKMCNYLRPQTLFGTKMDAYLNEV